MSKKSVISETSYWWVSVLTAQHIRRLILKYSGDVLIVLEHSPLYSLKPFPAWWGFDSSSVDLISFLGFVSAPCMIWHRNVWLVIEVSLASQCILSLCGFGLCQNPTNIGNVPKPRPISCGSCPETLIKSGLCGFNRGHWGSQWFPSIVEVDAMVSGTKREGEDSLAKKLFLSLINQILWLTLGVSF